MSNLLKEAIVDANALREAALKHAETKIVDKYSEEVRQTLEQLLEQDELGADPLAADPMGADPLAADPLAADPMAADPMAAAAPDDTIEEDVEDVPFAAGDDLSSMEGENLKNIPGEGEDVEVTLDLGSLRESINELQAEIDEELTFDENELADMLEEDNPSDAPASGQFDEEEDNESGVASNNSAGVGAAEASAVAALGRKGAGAGSISENDEDDGDIEISEELIDDLVEKLTVDMQASLSGWAGRSSEDQKWEMEKEFARRRSTDVEEDMKVLKQAQEELVFENKQLTSRLTQYEQVTTELKETLQTVNLSNARLLYTNRVLRNTSLNERQKNRIVEAISRADSVTEAKTIYNTLESTVESAPRRGPKSLSEAINRPASVIRASRHETPQTDPFAERMRRLAGITK